MKILKKIRKWALKWQVSFNKEKTISMLISNKRDKNANLDLFVGEVKIKENTEHYHLGILLSNDLNT